MKDKITVLIADDNTEFANTLSRYLEDEEDMSVIGIARDGEEAFKMIQGTHPDICLLDVIMPHVDGLGVLEKINEANMVKRPMCIMLSAVGQDKITQKATLLGAEYYVVKPFDLSEILARIETNLKRYVKSFSQITTYNYKNLTLNYDLKEVLVGEEVIKLTSKELEILYLFMKYPNKVFSKKNLYESVWEDAYAYDNDTINTHISNIRKKINIDLIETVWGMGYKLR